MAEKRYPLAYRLDAVPEGMTAEELQAQDLGGTDAVLLASIIYPEDGSLSILFVSKDGRTGDELPDKEWFKVWALLAHRLAESKTLTPGKKELCAKVHEIIWGALMDARKEDG